jgi:hypothetical protein
MSTEKFALAASAFCQNPWEGLIILPMGGAVPILVFKATTKPVVITAQITKGRILMAILSFVKGENKD